MYSLSQARTALSQPYLLFRELNRLYNSRLDSRPYDPDGVDVFAEEWDNLVILDACRYDMFAEQHELPGRLEMRWSRAAHTSEFLTANFDGADLRDTVYVTASPMLSRNLDRMDIDLHAVVDVWAEDGWDEEFRTVLPETMVRYALDAAERYPDKRLVVHFLQPHFPFVGPTGREYFEDLGTLDFNWTAIATGDIDVSEDIIWKAFRENLDIVLPHVAELMDELGGRTVVTSDHGQLLGERSSPIPIREYGHPPGARANALQTVPWLVHDNGPRREVTAEATPTATSEPGAQVDEETVEARLADLGYLD